LSGKTRMGPQKFCIPCHDLKDEELHYTDCGLDNIYLSNGFEIEDVDGEQYVTIHNLDGLHEAIGLHIVLEKKAPNGQEIRFLRTEMGLSQQHLGAKLGVSDQSVARWEKGQTDIPGTAVFSFKVLYVFSLMRESERAEILEEFISALDDLACSDEIGDTIRLVYNDEKWADAA
ncbi:MAG: helix-turn-helix domain-containing protein, partial [Pseudomonadota bacterium]